VYLLAFAFVMVGSREAGERRHLRADPAAGRVTFATLAAVPYFVLLMFTVFGLQVVDRSLGPILPLYLGEIGYSAASVPILAGVLFTTTAAAAAVGNQVSPYLLRRHSAALLVPTMGALGAASALVLGLSAPWAVLVGTGAVFGFALGVATTCTYTAATHSLPPSMRGVAFGFLTSAYLIGLAVSPVIAGLVGAQSMRAVFLMDAAALAALAWFVRRGMTRDAR
jgi:MFS family permease